MEKDSTIGLNIIPLRKVTSLLAKHDWHKATLEKQKLSLLTGKHGGVVEQIISASEEDK